MYIVVVMGDTNIELHNTLPIILPNFCVLSKILHYSLEIITYLSFSVEESQSNCFYPALSYALLCMHTSQLYHTQYH